MRPKHVWSFAIAVAVAAAGFVTAPAPAADDPRTQGCIESVPEPDSEEPVAICFTLYRPASASPARRAPVVLHGHGWGGSRTNDPAAFAEWLEQGFGVLSFDQRGFGESGGQAHVQDPDFEGEDVVRLVDLVAGLDWVRMDGPGDPRIGAIGGSYGGGFQFAGAFTDLLKRGSAGTRFDALVPETTWWDLAESLGPSGVPRTAWATALYAAGAQSLPDEVHAGFAYGTATGDWPSGQHGVPIDLTAFFDNNGPRWHVEQGRQLDIPVLLGQGITDNLFNLNQAVENFEHALTPKARSKSMLIGYNGGHALPSLVPTGVGTAGDPCSVALGSESFHQLRLRFLSEHLRGIRQFLPGLGQVHLATADAAACLSGESLSPNHVIELDQVISTVGAGAPVVTELAAGPLTVTGTPYVDADVTTLSADGRAFLALAVGTTIADARIVANNTMPLHEAFSPAALERTIELPAIAVQVPEGQKLFLVVSPFSDMSFGHGSRVPGAVTLDRVRVRLHVR